MYAERASMVALRLDGLMTGLCALAQGEVVSVGSNDSCDPGYCNGLGQLAW